MSVHKKKNNLGWYFQFYYQGKKIKKEKNPFTKDLMKTKTECQTIERKYKAYLEEENNGSLEKTLNDIYYEFIEVSKSDLKLSTKRFYERFERLYLPLLKKANLKELNVSILNAWKSKCLEISKSENQINRVFNLMRQVLVYANTMYNLNGGLQLPFLKPYKANKIEEHKLELEKKISQEQFDLMLSFLDLTNSTDYFYFVVLYVLYNTGLRIGELSALTVSDYKNKSLYINKDYIRVNGIDHIQPPKTENSIRIVPLDAKTNMIILDFIQKVKPKKILFEVKSGYVKHQVVGRVMKRLGTLANISDKVELHPHILRHSHASNLKDKGWNEYQIAKRLGNTAVVTSTTYVHVDMPQLD